MTLSLFGILSIYPEMSVHLYSDIFLILNCRRELVINVNHLAPYEENDDSRPFCYFQPLLACFLFTPNKYCGLPPGNL